MFAMIRSKPGISYAISSVARFTNNPKEIHYNAVKRIMNDLNGIIDYIISCILGKKKNVRRHTVMQTMQEI